MRYANWAKKLAMSIIFSCFAFGAVAETTSDLTVDGVMCPAGMQTSALDANPSAKLEATSDSALQCSTAPETLTQDGLDSLQIIAHGIHQRYKLPVCPRCLYSQDGVTGHCKRNGVRYACRR